MHTLTGKEFRAMVRGADFLLSDVAEAAGVAQAVASRWYNGADILASTYDKLVTGFEKLQEAGDE